LYNGVVDEVSVFTNALSGIQLANLFSAAAYAPVRPPVFQPIQRIGTTLLLSWSAVPGRAYQLQYKNNFSEANWSNVGAVIIASSNTATISDALASTWRFYRVVLLP